MKKLITYILLIIIGTALIGSTPIFNQYAEAQNGIAETKTGGLSPIPKPSTLPGPDLGDNPGQVEKNVFTSQVLPNLAIGLIGFVAVAALVMLIVAGVRYTVSFGSEEANEKAKNQIIFALTGLLISILAYTIVRIIIGLDFGDQDRTEREASQLERFEEAQQQNPESAEFLEKSYELQESMEKSQEEIREILQSD